MNKSIKLRIGRRSKNCFDWEAMLNTYRKYVTGDSVVLEIGASSIARTQDLATHCKDLIGVEYLPERLLNDFDNVHYILGDWQHLTDFIKPESIDLAICSHVIEHIPDDLRAIDELYEVLKPGGIAVMNTPNRKRLTRAVIETFAGPRKFPWWEHLREYSETDLIHLCNKSRFIDYTITAQVFGLHGGQIFCFFCDPGPFRSYANFWMVELFKHPYRIANTINNI